MAEYIKVKDVVLSQYFREDQITITHVEKPYGEFSSPVARIHRVENGKKTGLVEIPYENLDEIIEALHKAEAVNESIPKSEPGAELKAEVGGGE